MDAILERRSIRRYKDKKVEESKVTEILKAAMSAPSAGNQQPWHFIVIDEPNILNEIPKFHPYSTMLKGAALAILVCGDETKEKHKGYWVQDCSAATQNILIALQYSGLGGVWLGIYPREERVTGLRKLLGVPSHIIPFSLVSIGYPAEEKAPADRYDPERIHINKW